MYYVSKLTIKTKYIHHYLLDERRSFSNYSFSKLTKYIWKHTGLQSILWQFINECNFSYSF